MSLMEKKEPGRGHRGSQRGHRGVTEGSRLNKKRLETSNLIVLICFLVILSSIFEFLGGFGDVDFFECSK